MIFGNHGFLKPTRKKLSFSIYEQLKLVTQYERDSILIINGI